MNVSVAMAWFCDVISPASFCKVHCVSHVCVVCVCCVCVVCVCRLVFGACAEYSFICFISRMDSEELGALTRRQLQALAKQHGIKANQKSVVLIELLAEALVEPPAAEPSPAPAAPAAAAPSSAASPVAEPAAVDDDTNVAAVDEADEADEAEDDHAVACETADDADAGSIEAAAPAEEDAQDVDLDATVVEEAEEVPTAAAPVAEAVTAVKAEEEDDEEDEEKEEPAAAPVESESALPTAAVTGLGAGAQAAGAALPKKRPVTASIRPRAVGARKKNPTPLSAPSKKRPLGDIKNLPTKMPLPGLLSKKRAASATAKFDATHKNLFKKQRNILEDRVAKQQRTQALFRSTAAAAAAAGTPKSAVTGVKSAKKAGSAPQHRGPLSDSKRPGSASRPKFDLKASLAKPLAWKLKKGSLPPAPAL